MKFFLKHKLWIGAGSIAAISLVAIVTLGFNPKSAAPLTATTESAPTPAIDSPPETSAPAPDFYREAQERRARMLAEKENLEEFKKRQLAKEHSVECRFWKQQQELGKSDKANDKVIEHCQLPISAELNTALADNEINEEGIENKEEMEPNNITPSNVSQTNSIQQGNIN